MGINLYLKSKEKKYLDLNGDQLRLIKRIKLKEIFFDYKKSVKVSLKK